jgi:hypothetical protein
MAQHLTPDEAKRLRTERAEAMAKKTVKEWGEFSDVVEIQIESLAERRQLLRAIQDNRKAKIKTQFRMNRIAGDTEAALRELVVGADIRDIGLGFVTKTGLWGMLLYRELLIPELDGRTLLVDVPQGMRDMYANTLREPLRLAIEDALHATLADFPTDKKQ